MQTTLTKDRKSGFWFAHYRDEKNTPRRITTNCTNKIEAERVVEESGIADLSAAAKAGHLSKQVFSRIVAGKNLTMEKCLQPFEEWMRNRGRSEKTISNNLMSINSWMRGANLHSVPPTAATAASISLWINNPDNTSKQSSRKILLGAIRIFYGFLLAKGWVVEDVSQDVKIDLSGLSHEQRESGIRIPFAKPEVARLTAWLRSELADVDGRIEQVSTADDFTESGREVMLSKLSERRLFLAFWNFAVQVSFETGLRLSDICQLEWSCFATPGKLKVWSDKTNKRLELEFNDGLTELLTALPVCHAKYLFPEQRAVIRSVKKRGLLSVQFKRLCEKLEIHGKSFHCLRHGAATEKFRKEDKGELAERLAEVLTTAQIQQILGHSNMPAGIEQHVPP